MSSSNPQTNQLHILNKYQPAISAYAPASRNPLLLQSTATNTNILNNNNNAQSKRNQSHRTIAFITLYILLQYWDTPMIQSILQKLSSSSLSSNINLLLQNERIQSIIHHSKIGNHCQWIIKHVSLFIAKKFIGMVQKTRLNKFHIVPIPNCIHSFVNENNDIDNNNNNNNNENKNENESQIITISSQSNLTIIQQLNQQNQKINQILQYWFGQNTPEKSQKHLWMIGSSSQTLLNKVDFEIANNFTSILVDLVENKNGVCDIWCGRMDDINTTNENKSSVDGANEGTRGYGDDNDDFFGWRGKLAAIIVLDQMSRHIHRHISKNKNNNPTTTTTTNIPPQPIMDNLAYTIAKSIQQKHNQEIKCGMIPTPMLIFALMPYRHASTIQSVGFVQCHIELMSGYNSVDVEHMIRRFRRATNRRMAVLQDDARREGKNTFYDGDDGDDNEGNNTVDNGGKKSMKFTNDDILEFQPFDADMSNAKDHPIVKTVKNFLAARGIHSKNNSNAKSRVNSGSNGSTNKNHQGETDDNHIIRDTPIIVSLSGGVDSMVIANVLSYLRKECGYPHIYLAAVHIDYGNRPESSAEAAFVQDYALNYIHFDTCIIRRIDEVTRGDTKRDEYEKVSRNVRYDLYKSTRKQCMEICNHDNHIVEDVGVMLGHHRGDVVENVISNSNKGCGPLDLSGMTDVSSNDGVTIYRPLLPLDKDDVYDYSYKFGVPYFKDTTPHWSTRGKLRNKLIPLLEEVYGDGCLNNLAKLAEESDEARELFNRSAIQPFMDLVEHYPLGIIFSTAPFKKQGSYFWKIVLRDLLHSVGLGMFSDKSIDAFLIRALADKLKPGWLQCRKDYAVYLLSDGRVMVFYPQSFPWRKSDRFQLEGKGPVQWGKQESVGPWVVKTELVANSAETDVNLLEQKAVESVESVMTGQIHYYLEVLETENGEQSPLVFIENFTKETRPPCWKNTDLRIESTLPVLGFDTAFVHDNPFSCNTRYIRISLSLNGL